MHTATASTSLTVIDSPSSTAMSYDSATILLQLDTRQDDKGSFASLFDPLNTVLGEESADEEGEDFVDDYDEDCDDEDDFDDYEDNFEWRRRDNDEQYKCYDALSEVSLQLAEIKTMLGAPESTKREISDVVMDEDHGE